MTLDPYCHTLHKNVDNKRTIYQYNIMIEELVFLEQMTKLRNAAEDLEKQEKIITQTKFELLLSQYSIYTTRYTKISKR